MADRVEIDYNSLRSLVMQAPVSFLLLDGKNLIIKVVNQRVMDYTGKAYDDIIDKPFFEAFPEFGQFESVMRSIFVTRQTFTANEVPLHLLNWKPGENRYVNFILKPHMAGDTVTGIIGVASDVTELVKSKNASRENEDKFKAIFDTMHQGLAIVELEYDNNGNAVDFIYLEVNSAFEIESGIASVAGKKATDVLGEHAQFWIETFAKVRASGEKIMLSSNRSVTGRWFETNIFPIGGSGSNKVVFIFADISARKEEERIRQDFANELKEQVDARTAELNRSNRELLNFARAASHDLKEPVRKIGTFGSILVSEFEDQLPERAVGFIKKIIKSADRIRRMLDSMKSFISLEKPVKEFEPVDLNTLINNVLVGMEVLIEHKSVHFTVNPLPVIEGSPHMLFLLFQNILENSVKFSHNQRPVDIFIWGKEVTEKGNKLVEIEISDTGIGFSSEFSKSIFDSFVKLNSGEEFEGVGMGLSIVKQVVERHNGTITATGRDGEGASFRIRLPIKQRHK